MTNSYDGYLTRIQVNVISCYYKTSIFTFIAKMFSDKVKLFFLVLIWQNT